MAEVTIEEEDFRVTVRSTEEATATARSDAAAPFGARRPRRRSRRAWAGSSASSRRWSDVFYRQPKPGEPPFVEVGDVVVPARPCACSRR